MRKTLLLAMVLVLAFGLIFAWAEQNTATGKKIAKNVTSVFAKKAMTSSNLPMEGKDEVVSVRAKTEVEGVELQGEPVQQTIATPNMKPAQTETGMVPIDDHATKAADHSTDVVVGNYDKPVEIAAPIISDNNEVAAPAVEEPKWQPQYGEKGDLLNPEPVIHPTGYMIENGQEQYPVIATLNLFTETFEDAWGTGVPCTTNGAAWLLIDSGSCGTNFWWADDWSKFYYSTWSDTVARSIVYNAAPESTFDEWMITPAFDLSGAATCSLYWKEYYDDYTGTADSGLVYISTDNGTTWNTIVKYTADTSPNPKRSGYNLNSYVGPANTQCLIAYRHVAVRSQVGAWYVDSVTVITDGVPEFGGAQTFNGWGTFGNNPPSGWSIQDNGTPYPCGWNNNDFSKRSSMGTGNYVAGTTSGTTGSGIAPEFQNEWLISPMVSIPADSACTLSVAEYYSHSSSGYLPNNDHGYIKIQETTDGGTTWQPWVVIYDNVVSKGTTSSKTIYKYGLNAYRGKDVRVAFNYVNSPDGSDYWYFDDVKIDVYYIPVYDAATNAITYPAIGIQGKNNIIKTSVRNNSRTAQSFRDSTYIWSANKNTLFFEEFSNPQSWTGANPPVNAVGTWAVLDSGSIPGTWNDNDWRAYYYSTWTDTVARVYYSPAENQNEYLISPAINLTLATNARLTYRVFYDDYSDAKDTMWVYGSTDDFVTVQTLAMYQGADYTGRPDIDISSWALGSSNVKIAFRYKANDDMAAYLDEVEVYEALAPTVYYASGETTPSLNTWESAEITYSSTWNNPSPGTYNITSLTLLAGDEVSANDMVTSAVTAYAHTGTAGPDLDFYYYADDVTGGGSAYSWQDISAKAALTFPGTGDDRYTVAIPLGFSFTYRGNSYTDIYASENGFITFDALSSGYYTNADIPASAAPQNLLAFMWDDLAQGTGSAYTYTNNVDTFIISYVNWGWTSGSVKFDAQVILTADGNIKFQYRNFGPGANTGHTIGIENNAGTTGLKYVYNGVPMGNLPIAPLAITFYQSMPSIDASADNIVAPVGTIISGTPFSPKTRVSNNGGVSSFFDVFFEIYNAGGTSVYRDSVLAHSLAPGVSDTVTFLSTSMTTVGTYRCTTWVYLSGDATPSNDKITGTFLIDMHFGEGGPDAYLMKWIDNTVVGGPTYTWEELNPDTAGYIPGATQIVATGGDDVAYKFYITPNPPFPYYGVNYDSGWATSNGLITFGTSSTSYLNADIPNSATPNAFIAPFWDDLYATTGTSKIFYLFNGDHTTIMWEGMSIGSGGVKNLCFEVLLFVDGTIIVQYKDVTGVSGYQGQSATVGIESQVYSADAITGLRYLYNGTLPSSLNLLTNGLAIKYYQYIPTIDIAAVSYDAPKGGIVGTPYFPTVSVKNNGTTTVTADVTVKIYGPLPATTQVFNFMETSGSIAYGVTTPFTFSINSWTPAAAGAYICSVSVTTLGDEFASNNNTTGSATILSTATLPYSTDFEANNGGFLGINEWEWGTPTLIGPGLQTPVTHSGVNCWGTDLDSAYNAYANNQLYSPVIALTGAPRYSLDFWMWYRFESISYDGANLKISTDYGNTWTVITTSVPYTGTCTSTGNALLYGQQGWGGVDTAWTPVNVDLTPYAGQNVILRFDQGSEGSLQYAGLYIDDFAITQIFADVAVNSIDLPASTSLFPGSYQIGATLENLGLTTEILDSVVFSVLDPLAVEIFHETVTGFSLPVGTAPITSTGSWTGVLGIYPVTVTAYLASDGNTANNAVTKNYRVRTLESIPYYEPFNNSGWQSEIQLWYAGSGAGIYYTTSTVHGTAPDTALYFNYSPYPRDAWIVMAPVSLVGATAPRLNFWETADSYWGDDPLESHAVLIKTGEFDLDGVDTLLLEDPTTYTIGTYVWQNVIIDLSAYINDTVWVMYYYHGQTYDGGNWYLDDIAVEEEPVVDVAVNSIDAPPINFMNDLPPGSYPITATLENLGTSSATLDSIVYEVYDTTYLVFSDVRYGDVLPVGTAQFTSNNPWLAVGDCIGYDIVVTAYLSTDGTLGNNSYYMGYPIYVRDVIPNPFYEPFNGLTGFGYCWLYFGSVGLGARYHDAAPSVYFSGGNTTPRSSALLAPPIDLVGMTEPRLTMWESANYWLRDPNEMHYILVFDEPLNDPTHIDTLAVYDVTHYIPSGPTGTPFQELSFDLSAYIGDTIWVWIEYYSDSAGSNWYLDDIMVAETPHDMAALSILEPVSPVTDNVPFTPTTEVANLGVSTQTYDVTFDIYDGGGVIHTETLTGLTLDAGLLDTIAFTPYAITPAGTYYCTTYVAYTGDTDPANDKIGMELTVSPAGYEYMPGDANMEVAAWPPAVGPADVTRIISFFKGVVGSCQFYNPAATVADTLFWASADANGDCKIMPSDVTRLVAHFKAVPGADILNCIDYTPVAPVEANYPACTPTVPLKAAHNNTNGTTE